MTSKAQKGTKAKATRGAQQKTRAEQLLAAERKKKAFALRKGGASYPEIAEALGVSVSTAHGYVASTLEALQKEAREDADVIREMELMRLDSMWMALMPQMQKGHLQAIDKGLKIMERRSKFLGLDMPVKTALTNPDGTEHPLNAAAGGLASLLKAAEDAAKAISKPRE